MKIYNTLKKFIKKLLNRISSNYLGYSSINDFSDNDIFIVGYPKSGNTWFQNIIVELVYEINVNKIDDSLLQELVPDVHYKRSYKRFKDTMFFKSHFLPQPEYKKVVYLVRDGRDVMVSYFHYLSALGQVTSDLDSFISNFNFFPSKWKDHIYKWQQNPYNAQILIIRYEDLLDNTFAELKKFSDFANLKVSDSSILKAIDRTSFNQMQKKETKTGWDQDRNWPDDKKFVRKGKKGSYKDEMSKEAQEIFIREAHNELREFNYFE